MGNCQGEIFHELVENMIFTEKTFTDCLLVPPKDAMPPNVVKKTFKNSHKASNFVKGFSLEGFLLYVTSK